MSLYIFNGHIHILFSLIVSYINVEKEQHQNQNNVIQRHVQQYFSYVMALDGLWVEKTEIPGENNRPLQVSKSQSCIKYALPQRPKNIHKNDENTFISRYDR